MRGRYYFILAGLIFSCFIAKSQDSVIVHRLIREIAAEQVINDHFFMQGIFPSYIRAKTGNEIADNNIFFTGLVLYTLKNLRQKLPVSEKSAVDSIIFNSHKLFPRFKNRDGRESYNFWRTESSYPFPYNKWLGLIVGTIRLSDDPDCTSISELTLDEPIANAEKAHLGMEQFVNRKRTNTIIKRYRKYAAYSCWLTKSPVILDVCTLSNILTFVQTYNLVWGNADSSSLQLIIAAIKNKDYINSPVIVSPYYRRTPVILYHLSRLMSIKPIPALDSLKSELVQEAIRQLRQTKSNQEKIFLRTALLKWKSFSLSGERDWQQKEEIRESENYDPLFVASLSSFLPMMPKKILAFLGIGSFDQYCPAYNKVLLLEYIILKNEQFNKRDLSKRF